MEKYYCSENCKIQVKGNRYWIFLYLFISNANKKMISFWLVATIQYLILPCHYSIEYNTYMYLIVYSLHIQITYYVMSPKCPSDKRERERESHVHTRVCGIPKNWPQYAITKSVKIAHEKEQNKSITWMQNNCKRNCNKMLYIIIIYFR